MLRFKETNIAPPDGFNWRCPHDGVPVKAYDRQDWYVKIAKHCKDNGHVLEPDWKRKVDDELCRTLPPGWCEYEEGGEPTSYIGRRFTINDAIAGTKVLIEFVKQGAPIVSQEVAEERGKTCAACFALMNIPGCTSCEHFANYVAEAAGARKTKADSLLETKVCSVCLCSARANIWIPVEVSKAGVTPEMMKLFPEWCWKKKGIEALSEPPQLTPP